MASVNKCIFVGNLGRDPELKYTASGEAICNFSIACSESWKDKATGEKKELTEWVRISFFGKIAEICGQYLKKGSQVYIEGSMRTRKWVDKDGQERYTTEIKGAEMKMLGSAGDGQRKQPESQPAPQRSAQGSPPSKASFDDLGDDIPFLCHARGIVGHCM